MTGFEPATFRSRTERSTKLSYIPSEAVEKRPSSALAEILTYFSVRSGFGQPGRLEADRF